MWVYVSVIVFALVHCPVRNGGGIGEGSIRKVAYFQSSIDPSLSGSKEWMVYAHTQHKHACTHTHTHTPNAQMYTHSLILFLLLNTA